MFGVSLLLGIKFPLKDKTFRDQLLLYNSINGSKWVWQPSEPQTYNGKLTCLHPLLLTQMERDRLPYDCWMTEIAEETKAHCQMAILVGLTVSVISCMNCHLSDSHSSDISEDVRPPPQTRETSGSILFSPSPLQGVFPVTQVMVPEMRKDAEGLLSSQIEHGGGYELPTSTYMYVCFHVCSNPPNFFVIFNSCMYARTCAHTHTQLWHLSLQYLWWPSLSAFYPRIGWFL